MKQIKFKKLPVGRVVESLVIILSATSCSIDNFFGLKDPYFFHESSQLCSEFESNYVVNNSNKRIMPDCYKLIGFTTVQFSEDEQKITRDLFKEFTDKREAYNIPDGVYFENDGSLVRIYYPLKDAIIKYSGNYHIANGDGMINLPESTCLKNITIFGRAQSVTSVYTTFKIKLIPSEVYEEQKILVFDLGDRPRSCCNSARGKSVKFAGEDSNGVDVSCINNHKPYYNCSYAFPQYVNLNSDCVLKSDRCMDFNGFFSDCQGDRAYFIGSDCFNAVAHGECWNEIMR